MLPFLDNIGEYFASVYADENLEADLLERAALSDEDRAGIKAQLANLRKRYFEYKEEYTTRIRRDTERLQKTRAWHSELLAALGYGTDIAQGRIYIEDEGFVPVRATCRQGERTQLLVLEMGSQLPTATGQAAAGLFEQTYLGEAWAQELQLREDETISPKEVNNSISALFLLEEQRRPHYILLLAGSEVYLMERERWFRGGYLRLDLDLLFATASAKTGDYRVLLYCLLSQTSLSPSSGAQVLLDQLNEESHKRAYAVTKDLKEGVILAVEGLVNEGVWYLGRKERNGDAKTAKSEAHSAGSQQVAQGLPGLENEGDYWIERDRRDGDAKSAKPSPALVAHCGPRVSIAALASKNPA